MQKFLYVFKCKFIMFTIVVCITIHIVVYVRIFRYSIVEITPSYSLNYNSNETFKTKYGCDWLSLLKS